MSVTDIARQSSDIFFWDTAIAQMAAEFSPGWISPRKYRLTGTGTTYWRTQIVGILIF